MSENHIEALATVYIEACVSFRKAHNDGNLSDKTKFGAIMETLEAAYPEQITAIYQNYRVENY